MKDYSMYLLLFILAVAVIASTPDCKSEPRWPEPQPEFVIYRAKVLENSLISWVKLDSIERLVYRPTDSVWINLETHRICDTCEYAMRAQIFQIIKP